MSNETIYELEFSYNFKMAQFTEVYQLPKVHSLYYLSFYDLKQVNLLRNDLTKGIIKFDGTKGDPIKGSAFTMTANWNKGLAF